MRADAVTQKAAAGDEAVMQLEPSAISLATGRATVVTLWKHINEAQDPEKAEDGCCTIDTGGRGPNDKSLETQHPCRDEEIEVQMPNDEGDTVDTIEASATHEAVERDATKVETQNTLNITHPFGTRIDFAMTGIEVRRLTTQQSDSRKVFVVGFAGERDIVNPKNWSHTTRYSLTLIISFVAFVVGLASSIDSAALAPAANDFGISEVAESAATGIFLVGFGLGSLFAGPMSETVGRNPIYLITLSLYMTCVMASALAPNLGVQLLFRFLAGFFGSTPLTCVAGSLADMWTPLERVYTFPMFATIAFLGPVSVYDFKPLTVADIRLIHQ
jgi:hypothetical protein